MRIRFFNVRVLTMEEKPEETGYPVIEHGQVWVKDGKIEKIVEDGEISKLVFSEEKWDREIDGQGNLILPGFKNAHTHSAMTFLRSYADDLPLQQWLESQVFPMEAKLTAEDVYWLSKLAVMEYLTSGITSNFDMYFHQETIARASAECGFRTVLLSNLNDFVSSPEEAEEQYLKLNNFDPLITYRFGFHAEYTTSEPLLRKVAELAWKYKEPVFAHISETESEVLECKNRHGMTPPVYLDHLGLFEYGGGGYHCVYMTEEDLDLFEKKGLFVVTNPGSNMKLASGIAPVSEMLKRGISLGIGTDGPASNNCLDMFREMFLVTGLAKLREKDAAAVPAEEVLKMAVTGGAKAMGLSSCDCLAEGKAADLIMIDLHQPNMQPFNDLVKNLVYSGSKQNVKLTMVNGKILYENGEFFIGVEAETVYQKANEIIERMKKEK